MTDLSRAVTIGYVGLGSIGFPIAARLARSGFRLVVRDTNRGAMERFTNDFPATTMADHPEAFNDSSIDVVMTMLPNGDVVREVLLGEQGIARHLKRGCVVVDTSSSSPFHTRELGKALAELGIGLIDAPVTQKRLHGIAAGEATFMIGSDSNAYIDTAMPLLKVLSAKIFIMGSLGSGHATKALNNYVAAQALGAVYDALVAGQKFGLEPQAMVDVLNVGTGQSFISEHCLSEEGLHRTGFQLSLLIKDVKIARTLINSTGFETLYPDATIRYLEHAETLCAPGACLTESMKGWEDRAGIRVELGVKTESQGAQ